MIQLVDVLTRTEAWLRERGIDTPRFDAELLLCHVLQVERMQLYLAHDRPMDDHELEALRALVRRRGAREPMAYITGSRGFHAIDLAVTPGVLIPRPDTETLVNATLEWIGVPTGPVYIADLGTGTGAVALALATALPEARVYATDISPEALALAKTNTATLGLSDRVAVLNGPWLDPIPAHRPIDWVVSNPPYIRTRHLDGLQPEVANHEPRLALDGGRDGLVCYRQIIPAAAARAAKGCLVEVGHDQADAVAAMMEAAGLIEVRTWTDLGGHRRVVGGRTTPSAAPELPKA